MPSSFDRVVANPLAPSFAARLIDWQKSAGRHDLPWQGQTDPYRVWLSEIMLQQTQVAAVLPYYAAFLQRFPTLADLADAPVDAVMAAWAGLGYYSRARNLYRCAHEIVHGAGGVWPQTREALAQLPGIGRSTAAAIAVFAFGQREAILDGNVKRVLCRVFGIALPMDKPASERELVRVAEALLPHAELAAYTQGLMDLGATVCTARSPQCTRCPFASACVAHLENRIHELPLPRQKAAVPERQASFALLRCGAAVWLERRPESGIWGGLWCLPEQADAGVALSGENFVQALARRLGAAPAACSPVREVARFRHAFTHYTLKARVFAIELAHLPAAGGGRWATHEERKRLGLPRPMVRLLQDTDLDAVLA